MAEKKAPAPAAKKTVAAAKPVTAAVKKSAPPAASASAAATKPAKAAVSPEQRWKLVAEAAYYLAEKRGFAAGHSVADWLAAERQVDAKLRS